MSANIYSFVSAKGGSGKTVTAISMSKVLAGLGKKILIIDTDASTNGLSLFFINEILQAKQQLKDSENSLTGAFDGNEVQTATPCAVDSRIDVIPASYVMSQTEETDPESFRKNLRKTVDNFRSEYDYIFLDAQAGADIFAQVAVDASDEIVIVSEYDPMSALGVDRLRYLFRKKLGEKPEWILFNKILPEFAKSLGEFLAVARYLPPIPWDADVVRAYVRRGSAIDMERGNFHTLAAIQTALSLFGKEIEEEAAQWKKKKEQVYREPSQKALADIVTKIGELESMKIRMQYRVQDLERIVRFGAFVAITSLGTALFYLVLKDLYSATKLGYSLFDVIEKRAGSIATIIVTIPLTLFGTRVFFARLSRKREVKIMEEVRVIETHLDELRAEREKYKSLLDADIEAVIGMGFKRPVPTS